MGSSPLYKHALVALSLRNAITILRGCGVKFDSKQQGRLLVIRHGGRTIDYWPTTQRFRDRDVSHSHLDMSNRATSEGVGIGPMLGVLGYRFAVDHGADDHAVATVARHEGDIIKVVWSGRIEVMRTEVLCG